MWRTVPTLTLLALLSAQGCPSAGLPFDSMAGGFGESAADQSPSEPSAEADVCQVNDWYADGVCDPDCRSPDPDCEDTCALNGWYMDGVCDTDCAQPDPDCDDACALNGYYGDGVCDPDCPLQDPDCS
ncbi:MAG: hypothetical protein ACPMAQ_14045 [Phycisphaerae bacterium]